MGLFDRRRSGGRIRAGFELRRPRPPRRPAPCRGTCRLQIAGGSFHATATVLPTAPATMPCRFRSRRVARPRRWTTPPGCLGRLLNVAGDFLGCRALLLDRGNDGAGDFRQVTSGLRCRIDVSNTVVLRTVPTRAEWEPHREYVSSSGGSSPDQSLSEEMLAGATATAWPAAASRCLPIRWARSDPTVRLNPLPFAA